MALSSLRSRELVIVITAFCGLVVFFGYFFPNTILMSISSELQVWAVLAAAFAWGIGLVRQFQLTAVKVQARRSGWQLSIYGAVMTLVMIFFGLAYGTKSGGSYDWMFTYILLPVRTTTVALTAPFIFSAGFRAFRARNTDSTLFLIAGLLIMMSAAPIGELIWSGFPIIGKWILTGPQAAVSRGLLITTGLGLAAFGIRYIAGLEAQTAEEMIA